MPVEMASAVKVFDFPLTKPTDSVRIIQLKVENENSIFHFPFSIKHAGMAELAALNPSAAGGGSSEGEKA